MQPGGNLQSSFFRFFRAEISGGARDLGLALRSGAGGSRETRGHTRVETVAEPRRTLRNFSSAGACALLRVSFSSVSRDLSLLMSFRSCCRTVSSTTLWPGA